MSPEQTLGDTARAAVTTTLLGMTYAARGDTAWTLTAMDSAALARRSGTARSQSYARYRQGQLLRTARVFDAAEEVRKPWHPPTLSASSP